MKKLIVIGASARAAAYSAQRAGFAPYAIDLFADRDLAAICPAVKIAQFPREFLTALAATPQAPWIYTGGLENHPRLVERLAAIRPLLGNGGDTVHRVRDPIGFASAVNETECHSPRIARSRGEADKRRWLVKPRRSGGGLGIRFATDRDTGGLPRGTYLQEYVEGESASAVFVAAGGRAVLLGATRQLGGRDFGLDRPFLYVGSIGPLSHLDDEAMKLDRLGTVLANRFGLVGLFNVDFVRTERELWPVEVNPRYSASVEILERILEVSLLDLHVKACEMGALPEERPWPTSRFAGKAVVYARRNGFVPPALDNLIREWNQPGQWPGLVDLPRVGEMVRGGQPVVTVLAEGGSADEVDHQLRRRSAHVLRFLGAHDS
jgi:uncharacterized protein